MTDAAGEEAWQAAVSRVLKGGTVDSLASRTRDDLVIRPLERPAGEAPFHWRDTRRPIVILQRVDHPEPDEARTLARLDIENGATGLVLVGQGSPSAYGFGLSPQDWPVALEGPDLGRLPIRFEVSPPDTARIMDEILSLTARQGFAPEALDLDLGLDPLDPFVAATARDAHQRGLNGLLVRADGRPHHAAGASEAQELAAVLSAGVAGLRALEPEGLDVARSGLGFTLAADADEVLTIAKLRALRRLWARVEDACGLVPKPIRLHVETAWRMLARQDPHTNILRATLATASAILGGADSLTVLPFTTALGLPDAMARRLARNTPLLLLEEAHLGRVADPAAGAGTFEAVTDGLVQEGWRLFQGLEAEGGLAATMASGRWPRAVAAMAEKRRSAIASGEAPIVGTTRFTQDGASLPPVLRPLPVRDEASDPARFMRRDAAEAGCA